jgi:predicted ribosome quality control (RQC) complex YloA/Tae2 family protein
LELAPIKENHISNYYLLERLVSELDKRLIGLSLEQCYSTNKSEIVFSFGQYVLKGYFGEESFVFIQEKDIHASVKNKPAFPELIGKKVSSCKTTPQDRSFRIAFENGFTLVFMMYGRNGNVILFKGNDLFELFRTQFEKHKALQLSYFHSYKIPKYDNFTLLSQEIGANGAIAKLFSGFSKGMISYLAGTGITEKSPQEQWNQIRNFEQLLLTGTIDIIENENKSISLTLLSGGDENVLFSSAYVIAALQNYASRYFSAKKFTELKANKIRGIQSALAKNDSGLESAKNHLYHLENDSNYKRLADIIMANLHQIPKGAEKVKLFDFYSEAEIEIEMKRGLTPQSWAEKLYRKAKNQEIEKQKVREKIIDLEKKSLELKRELEDLEAIDNLKNLKAEIKQIEPTVDKESPFKYFTFEGFEIYAGKNSANNDKLTFGFAHKDDLWLHASGVSGSHVIIKHKQKINFPNQVIEKAASIAAFFSKSKGSIMVPVVYTLRKFVRKPKGAAPGAVIIEKEKMIMARPLKMINNQ